MSIQCVAEHSQHQSPSIAIVKCFIRLTTGWVKLGQLIKMFIHTSRQENPTRQKPLNQGDISRPLECFLHIKGVKKNPWDLRDFNSRATCANFRNSCAEFRKFETNQVGNGDTVKVLWPLPTTSVTRKNRQMSIKVAQI